MEYAGKTGLASSSVSTSEAVEHAGESGLTSSTGENISGKKFLSRGRIGEYRERPGRRETTKGVKPDQRDKGERKKKGIASCYY